MPLKSSHDAIRELLRSTIDQEQVDPNQASESSVREAGDAALTSFDLTQQVGDERNARRRRIRGGAQIFYDILDEESLLSRVGGLVMSGGNEQAALGFSGERDGSNVFGMSAIQDLGSADGGGIRPWSLRSTIGDIVDGDYDVLFTVHSHPGDSSGFSDSDVESGPSLPGEFWMVNVEGDMFRLTSSTTDCGYDCNLPIPRGPHHTAE